MDGAHAQLNIRAAIRRSRQARARLRAPRRKIVLAACALLAVPAGIATALLVLPDSPVAQAAAAGAKSLTDLINGRSPGERNEGALTKTKHARALAKHIWRAPPSSELADVPIRPYAPTLAEAVLATSPLMPPPGPEAFLPLIEGGPPGSPGLIGVPPGPGSFTPPEGLPETNPSLPPETIPAAVPEPGTWALMLVGFGLIGWRVGKTARATIRLA
jgi:hypothetical protein